MGPVALVDVGSNRGMRDWQIYEYIQEMVRDCKK